MIKKSFKINSNKGFWITFANKVTVSVQFGPGNYCENYDMPFVKDGKLDLSPKESNDAEIAILGKDGEWLTRKCKLLKTNDDVVGHVSPELLLKVLIWTEKYKEGKNA